MHDEGYIIVPDGQGGLAVIAETSAGIFYGAQTVKQLIRGSGKDEVLLVPTLRDWPAMAHRGLSDDWSRGRCQHGFPEARDSHPGGLQGQHLLALL
jgi:hexosaminidase